MKILLTTPPQPQKKAAKSKKNVLKRGLLPALGIGFIAGVLERDGHKVHIIDSPVFDYDLEDIFSEIKSFAPDVVGISTMTPTADNATHIAERVHKEMPGTTVIMGGSHPTCYPLETIKSSPAIDAVVVGEGEMAVSEIVKRIENDKGFDNIPGVLYRTTDNEIKQTEEALPIDLNEIPFPSRHLYPILNYAPEPYENKRLPSTNIIVSRGCTWAKCTFCHRSGKMKRLYRYQSPEKTIEEIKLLINKFGIRELVFYDDDLFGNKKWVNKFCDLMQKEHFDLIWSCRSRVDTASYELLKKAKEVGLWSIFYGFESGNQDLLDKIKKGATLEQGRQAAKWCHSLGIEIVGSFMLALPGEDMQKGLKTIEFAKELDCDYASFIPTHPFIGTELYQQCLDDGKIIENPYDEKMEATRFIPRITYVPDGYESKDQIEQLIKNAYKGFYFRPSYFWKHLKKMKNMEDIKKYFNGFLFILGLT